VVAIFCSQLAAGGVPVIHGSGEQTRDFIFVADVVSAIIAALEFEGSLASGGPGGSAYNISTGEEVSVTGLATALRPIAGFYAPYGTAPERAGDVVRSSLDPSKARDVFGWQSRVALDVGLGPTYRWFAHP